MMTRHATVVTALQLTAVILVSSAKQQVPLSDSYLPVAMQIIAHLTDQMAFESRDDVTPFPRPTTTASTPRPTTTQTPRTTKPTWTWSTSTWSSTSAPYVTSARPGASKPTTSGWWTSYTTTRRTELTTPFHKPGLFAPFSPPKPFINRFQSRDLLQPLPAAEYGVLAPAGGSGSAGGPLLGVTQEEVQPLVEPGSDEAPLLPPHFDVKITSRSDGYLLEDVSPDSLQLLPEVVRGVLQDPQDDGLLDVWQRAGAQPGAASKAKLSGSNLRLLLLYDLLSRDAKKQRLSDYSGFSPDVMKVLVDSSSGGARAQLRTALARMLDRHDCGHDYANNRAREMVEELAKDESKLSSELRYLQPLVYKY